MPNADTPYHSISGTPQDRFEHRADSHKKDSTLMPFLMYYQCTPIIPIDAGRDDECPQVEIDPVASFEISKSVSAYQYRFLR